MSGATSVQDFDFNVDLLRHVLWQYNDAERLQALIASKQDWYARRQDQFWTDWIRDVFNLQTANAFGLAVWGRILGESREVRPADQRPDHPAFGFGPTPGAGVGGVTLPRRRRNFSNGNFRRVFGGRLTLSVDQYRLLLRLRYFKLVSRGTVPEINDYLDRLFEDRGRVWVLDPLDMTFAVYVFTYAPSSLDRYVLTDMDALPRPAGVGSAIRIVARDSFGLGEHHLNYSGTFAESPRGNP